MNEKTSLTYRDAGVDIEAANELVERIKPLARRTRRPEVLQGLGGFGALFKLPVDKYKEPILVASTDGVGTKLKLAIEMGRHESIGIDLVAMCVNDVLVQGAEPLFFLDYFATGRLQVDVAEAVISGIAAGCGLAGAALIGGETAEMPGMYQGDEYDLAGFCVGIVEKGALVDGSQVREGDVIVGLSSSGPHSNGYSMIRKVIEITDAGPDSNLGEHNLGDLLLAPTRIYVKSIHALLASLPVRAMAHITGGGLPGNVPRSLPDGLEASIEASAWTRNPIFNWLQKTGNISDQEMYRTFNCGIGMTVVVSPDHVEQALQILALHGESASVIGKVQSGSRGVVISG